MYLEMAQIRSGVGVMDKITIIIIIIIICYIGLAVYLKFTEAMILLPFFIMMCF